MLPINSTYILTPELKQGGWKLMSELEPGDRFYIFDKESKNLKLQYFNGFQHQTKAPVNKLKYLFNDIFVYTSKLEKYSCFSGTGGYHPNSKSKEFDDMEYLKILLYLLGTFGYAKKSEYGYYMYEIYLDKIKNNPLVPDNMAFIRSIQNLGRTLDIPARKMEDGNTLIINLTIVDGSDTHTFDYTKDLHKWIEADIPYIDSAYANHFIKSARSILTSLGCYYNLYTSNYKDIYVFQNIGIISGRIPIDRIFISDMISNEDIDNNFPYLMFEADFLNYYHNHILKPEHVLPEQKDKMDIWKYLRTTPPEEVYVEVAELTSGIIVKQILIEITGVPHETLPHIICYQ